jgi:hypothetical protein
MNSEITFNGWDWSELAQIWNLNKDLDDPGLAQNIRTELDKLREIYFDQKNGVILGYQFGAVLPKQSLLVHLSKQLI